MLFVTLILGCSVKSCNRHIKKSTSLYFIPLQTHCSWGRHVFSLRNLLFPLHDKLAALSLAVSSKAGAPSICMPGPLSQHLISQPQSQHIQSIDICLSLTPDIERSHLTSYLSSFSRCNTSPTYITCVFSYPLHTPCLLIDNFINVCI